MPLRHTFVSAFPDGPDATKLRPSDWNADHAFSGGALGSLLFRDTGASDGADWIPSGAGFLAATGAGQVPAFRALEAADIPMLGVAQGGTGLSSLTTGDLLYASGAAALSQLAGVATGSVLVSGGVGVAPAWSDTPTLTDLTLTGVGKFADGTAAAPSIAFASDPDTGLYSAGANTFGFSNGGGFSLLLGGDYVALRRNAATIYMGASDDVALLRDAANTLALRNGVNAQTFRVFNAFTDASNYERGVFSWNEATNILFMGTQEAGTGTSRVVQIGTSGSGRLAFQVANGVRWYIDGTTAALRAEVDNTYDIGASGATRPRSIYAGTSITAPAYTVGSTPGASFSGPVTNITVVNGIVTAAS